jgi:Flp pilus assembly CpaF family ATPase
MPAQARENGATRVSPIELPYRAIKSNIADSLNVLVHVERRRGRRLVTEVQRIAGYHPEHDRYAFEPIFTREQQP